MCEWYIHITELPSEGPGPTHDDTLGPDKADAVPTGGTHTYTWQVPDRPRRGSAPPRASGVQQALTVIAIPAIVLVAMTTSAAMWRHAR